MRVAGGAAGRCSAAAGGSPCGHSRACRSAFDAMRARDAARAADRPRRRPWWPWSVHGGAHSRKPSARCTATNYHSQAHSSRSPTHAHSHPRPQCGRCRERLPPRAQLHTGTELSASQARSSVQPSGRPTVRRGLRPGSGRGLCSAYSARCSAKRSKHPFPNSCPLSPTPTVWEWPRAVATAQPHIGTATARYTIGSKAAAGKGPKGDHRSGGSPPQRAHRGWPRV